MSTLQKLSFALVGTAIVFMSVKPASAVTLTPVTGTGTINANRQDDLFTHVPELRQLPSTRLFSRVP